MDLGETLAHHARNDPDDLAVVFDDGRRTWKALDGGANSVGNALLELGAERGDRALLLLDNSVEFVESYYGLAKVGCVSAPVMPSLVPGEIGAIAETLDPAFVITGGEHAHVVDDIETSLGDDHSTIGVGGGGDDAHSLDHDYRSLVDAASDDEPGVDVESGDVLTIKATGGTTGTPKGCVRTHENFVVAASIALVEIPLEDDDRSIISTPLAAGMAVSLLTRNVYRGVPSVILPSFDPGDFLEAVEREGVTLATVMEPMARRLVEHPHFEEADLGSLRLLASINARDLLERFRDQETFDAGFYSFYGSSESGGGIVFKKPAAFERELSDPEYEHRLESLGREALLTRVAVLDDDQEPVPRGEVGELAVRGPTVFQGYWERPEKTAEVFEDGWLLTGDLAIKDEDGYVYLRGRKDDMIQTGGMNVYPAEVEPVLESHDDVVEAAVVGVPDEEWGERVVACVVPSGEADEAALLEHCREHLAGYKRPKQVVFRDELPKNEASKVLKRDIVATLAEGRDVAE